MSAKPGNFQNDVRWIPVYNRSGEIIPPFAAMVIGQYPDLRERQLIWGVTKPDNYSEVYQRPEKHLFNGSTAIPIASGRTGWGAGTQDYPAMALIETADDADEAAYAFYRNMPIGCAGFRAGSWKLHYGEEAYTLLAAIDSQEDFYSSDGSARAFVVPNIKPIRISAFLLAAENSLPITAGSVRSVPVSASATIINWNASDNGYGVQVPLTGLYQCELSATVTVNDDEPSETLPDIRVGMMASVDSPILTNWVTQANWSGHVEFNYFPGWGWWNTWTGWTDWITWGGWGGYASWNAGTRTIVFTASLTRGQWIGVGVTSATSFADVDVNATLSLQRL